MMYACEKICIVPMIPVTRLKKMYGDSIGSVTLRNFRHGPAPSISADSYRCCGIPFSPASQITMLDPALHRPMMMIAVFDPNSHDGLASQRGGSFTPNMRSSELSNPICGFNTHNHSSELATTGTIAG